MPTASELRELDNCQFGHGVVIHGINLVFVDHADLVSFNWGGSRVGRIGLSRSGLDWRHSVDLRRGIPDTNPWRFTITDFDGDLARLFAAVDDSERPLRDVPIGLGENIYPNDSLAARTELHGLHVGTERIGPAGERGLYPSPIGFGIAGKHTISVEGIDLASSPVSENPIVWAGRRVTLYRVYRDHVTYPERTAGTVSWRPVSEAVVRQFGILRDQGTVRGREWTLEADGPDGMLRKPLAVGFHPTPVKAVADITLDSTTDGARQDGIGVQLYAQDVVGSADAYGGRGFVTDITATTTDTIRDQIIAEIAAAAAAATDALGNASSVWEDQAGYQVSMETDGSVRIGVPNIDWIDGDNFDGPAGGLVLVLHKVVWALLGYDVELQNSLHPDPEDPRAMQFAEVTGGSFSSLVTGPGYYRGVFVTGLLEWTDSGGLDNHGVTRIYKPQYKGGTSVLSKDAIEKGGQVVRLADATLGLGASSSTVAHPGQYDRPIASDPADPTAPIEINGFPCDRQGLWLFYGKRRFQNSDETFDEAQVVRACWIAAGAQQDGLVSGDTIIVTELLTPRLFGLDADKLQSDWVTLETSADDDGGRMNAIPLANLGYNDGSHPSWAHIALQRLMYSSGTANGWSGPLGSDPTQDSGDNEPSGDHTIVRDAEISELGLCIPEDFIHPPSAWQTAKDKVEQEEVLYSTLAVTPGYQAIDAVQSMLQPSGLAMHLRDGRFGIWCPADGVTQEDVDVVLDRTTKRGQERGFTVSHQDLRKWQPVDKWVYQYGWNPQTRKTTKTLEQLSPDSGYRYRPGEVEEKVLAHGMRKPDGVGSRTATLSKWWARRHFEVKGYPVHAVEPGERCWPGTIVRITDATLVDVLGEYGVSGRLGVITSVTHRLEVEDAECLLDILVFADTSSLSRVHAISARATAYDTASRTLTCAANWLGIETDDDSWRDAPLFSEPLYTGIAQFGGAANITCYQWDGVSWNATLTGTVESTTSTTIVLANGSTHGTYLRDMDTIVVLSPADSQDAGEWPLQLYSPICNDAGTFVPPGGGTQDGYPWEP